MKTKAKLVNTSKGLAELGVRLSSAPEFGYDNEASSKDPHPDAPLEFDKLFGCGFSFGFEDGFSCYIPIAHRTGGNAPRSEALSLLFKVLGDKSKTIWAHNWLYDLSVPNKYSIEESGGKEIFVPSAKLADSMLAIWILNLDPSFKPTHKLKPVVEKYLKHKMITWEEIISTKMRFDELDVNTATTYGSDDALQALRLGKWCVPQIDELKMSKVFWELECPFVHVLRHMEDVGMEIDREFLLEYNATLRAEMEELNDKFYSLTGVEISKDQQISAKMYDEKKWWPSKGFERGKSGFFSVDKKHRERIGYQLKEGSKGYVALELKDRYSVVAKVASTYTTSLVERANVWEDKRLRCSWLQHGTDTGRFASRNPNLQNIPIRTETGMKIRKAFIAPEGWTLGVIDQSQFELRIMAHLSRDPMLMKAYIENIDLHQQTADHIHGSRGAGKVTNLALIYEQSPTGLSHSLRIPLAQGKTFSQLWHATYSKVGKYHIKQHNIANKYGYVRTITNRIRRIPRLDKLPPKQRGAYQRIASNTPCQGSAADIMKIAMRNAHREWLDRGVLYNYWTQKGDVKMTCQVHDELILEFKKSFAEEGLSDIKRHMETAVELAVPLLGDGTLASNWLEGKDAL